jgi:hypothetical protein
MGSTTSKTYNNKCSNDLNFKVFLNKLKLGIKGHVQDNCKEDLVVAPDKFYYANGIFRFNNLINGHLKNNSYGDTHFNCNYMGPNPNNLAIELISEGWFPISLSDYASMIHDIMYELVRNKDDGFNSDESLNNNLQHVVSKFGEPKENTTFAKLFLSGGDILRITAVGEKGTFWKKDAKTKTKFGPIYEQVINTLLQVPPEDRVIIDIGYLNEWINSDGIFILPK